MSKIDLYNYAGSSNYWEAEDITSYFEDAIRGIFGDKLGRLRIYSNGRFIAHETEKIGDIEGADLRFELILKKSVENLSDDQLGSFYEWICTLNDITKKGKFTGTPDLNYTPYEKDKKYMVLSFNLKL